MSAERRGNRGEDEVSREEVSRSHVRIKANMSKLGQSSMTVYHNTASRHRRSRSHHIQPKRC